jgi:hypothetical protein
MEDATDPQAPPVYFATEPYVEKVMAQARNELTEAIFQMGQRTEERIERLNQSLHAQTRWLIGLLVGLGLTLVLAILITPFLGA